jgi:hypothetical protein
MSHALSLAEAHAMPSLGRFPTDGHKVPVNWWSPILKHGSTLSCDDSKSKAFEEALAGLREDWDRVLTVEEQRDRS